MYEVARIEDFRVNAAGTELKLFIPKANYLEYLTAKRVHSCGIWIEDGRHITAEQRKKIYATIRDITAKSDMGAKGSETIAEDTNEIARNSSDIKDLASSTGNNSIHLKELVEQFTI